MTELLQLGGFMDVTGCRICDYATEGAANGTLCCIFNRLAVS